LAQGAHIFFGFAAMHFLTVTANVNCLLGSFQVILYEVDYYIDVSALAILPVILSPLGEESPF